MVDSRIQKEVFELTKRIPEGKVSSYKEIARKLIIHPRVVAHSLALNKHPVIIPCHRVVHADGRIGGYTPKGKNEKIKLLKKEGVYVLDGKIDKKYFYYQKKQSFVSAKSCVFLTEVSLASFSGP